MAQRYRVVEIDQGIDGADAIAASGAQQIFD
jgi:hypothetical protein